MQMDPDTDPFTDDICLPLGEKQTWCICDYKFLVITTEKKSKKTAKRTVKDIGFPGRSLTVGGPRGSSFFCLEVIAPDTGEASYFKVTIKDYDQKVCLVL